VRRIADEHGCSVEDVNAAPPRPAPRPWPVIAETAHLAALAAAETLNRRGVKTASGKPWHAMQLIRLRDRLGL
jgi:hypothetical protein